MYGITPDELRERFLPEEGWEIAFVHESVFEWWYSHNRASLAGVIKRE